MKHTYKYIIVLTIAVFLFLQSCQQPGGNSTGSEYMPDMSHSIAYEANYYNYYYNNTWGSEEEYYTYAKPKKPVKGTVPRSSSATISVPNQSKSSLYPYGDTDDERTRATNEIINNPLPITAEGLARGKELYNINCGICHGDKGDGNGYLVRDNGGVYPVQPAILNNDEFTGSSNGRFYHSIMYGKNLMGSYKDKLNEQERWEVIHYIRSLQAKERKLQYTQLINTLNDIDKPAGEIKQVAELETGHHEQDEHNHHGDNHGHTKDHDDHKVDDHNHDQGDGHEHGDDHNHDHDHDNGEHHHDNH